MSRHTQRQPDWRPHPWRPATGKLVASRLRRHVDEIAKALHLDEKAVIEDALEDLQVLLLRCLAFLRDVDRTASPARQRVNLIAFRDCGAFTADALWKLDPATFNRIARHYPGKIDPSGGDISDRALRVAVGKAIDELGPPRRGRPRETDSLALRQFALCLAHIYHSYTGQLPTRRRDPAAERDPEYGPFRDFISLVLSLLPGPLRSVKSGGHNAPDYLVRMAVEEYRAGLESGDPRRVYLIDEALWLAL